MRVVNNKQTLAHQVIGILIWWCVPIWLLGQSRWGGHALVVAIALFVVLYADKGESNMGHWSEDRK